MHVHAANRPASDPQEQLHVAVKQTRFQTAGPPLSRPEIVDAAMAYADRGELDDLTIRRLAGDLDVTPMALYRHVRDKDDLLEQVTDVLLARAGLPDQGLDWAPYLGELARSLRRVLREHPATVSTFTSRPQSAEMSRARLESARAVLTRAGFDAEGATRAYAAVHTYTVGFCALEASRHRAPPARPASLDLHADEVRSSIGRFVTEDQFEFGLGAIIAGLAPTRSG